MKKIVFPIAITIFFLSCFVPYGKIIRERDSYKKENRVYIKFSENAKPSKTNYGAIFGLEHVELNFEKVFDLNSDSLKYLKLTISNNLNSDKIFDNIIFFKTDNEVFEYSFDKIDNIYYTKTEEVEIDSTSTKTIDKTMKRVKNSLTLPISLITEIENTYELNIRVYFDNSPYDIFFNFYKIDKLKLFLRAENSIDKDYRNIKY